MMVRTDKSVLSRWWWSIDRLTFAALAVLAVTGLILVSAASPAVAERLGLKPFYFVDRHIIFLIPSLALMFLISLLDQKTLWRASTVILAVSLAGMVLALLCGAQVKGATRWVSFLGGSLQPSEFAKPSFAIVSAWL